MTPRKQIAKTIKDYNHFLLTSHVNPDGDAIGSMLGLGHLLTRLGKSFTLYNQSGLPERFSWLDLPARIHTRIPDQEYDWAIILDCGDGYRPGDDLGSFLDREKFINIDHHYGNPEFGKYNWVEPGRSSVGEMIALLAQDLGMELSGELGRALYLAMVTDTGSFSYSNTGAETFRIAAEIINEGLDLDHFNSHLFQQWSLNKVHLHGLAMEQANLYNQGRIGLIKVPAQLMQQTGSTPEDCEGVVNYVRSIKGVKVAVSLREDAENKIKMSLRSWGEVDVNAIAHTLGGGGHHNAAGGTFYLSMQEAEQLVLGKISEHLDSGSDENKLEVRN
ncbi:MAG: DHH family phosphoesterase [Thermodesulfobacteriota bacterium]